MVASKANVVTPGEQNLLPEEEDELKVDKALMDLVTTTQNTVNLPELGLENKQISMSQPPSSTKSRRSVFSQKGRNSSQSPENSITLPKEAEIEEEKPQKKRSTFVKRPMRK